MYYTKSFLLLNTFLFVVLFCAQTNCENLDEAISCEPNGNFKINCNTCKCGESGTWAQCDVEYCDPNDTSKYMKPPKNCADEGGWFDGCNYRDCDGIGNRIGCKKNIGTKQNW